MYIIDGSGIILDTSVYAYFTLGCYALCYLRCTAVEPIPVISLGRRWRLIIVIVIIIAASTTAAASTAAAVSGAPVTATGVIS